MKVLILSILLTIAFAGIAEDNALKAVK